MSEPTPRSVIGIMGGTFDPVHHAHLRTAIEFRDALELAQLRFVPCHRPPHRAAPGASSRHRLAMLRLALAAESRVVIDEQELTRDGPSYTVDTLRALRDELGDEVSLCLLVGSDTFNLLDTWHEWQQICDLAHLVVAERPGYVATPGSRVQLLLDQREVNSAEQLRRRAAGFILRSRFTLLDISSSAIRAQRHAGRSLRYLLPDAVIEYIEETDLYAGPAHQPGSDN